MPHAVVAVHVPQLIPARTRYQVHVSEQYTWSYEYIQQVISSNHRVTHLVNSYTARTNEARTV